MVIIKNYPAYSISKAGKVWSAKLNDFMSQARNQNGYMSVMLYNKIGSRRLYVHRLVAEAYLKNPLGKPCVNHKDSNKEHNHYKNLEWATRSENSAHCYKNNDNTKKTLKNNSKERMQPYSAVNLNTGRKLKFDSLKEAHNAGFDYSSIRKNIKGMLATVKGFIFKEGF